MRKSLPFIMCLIVLLCGCKKSTTSTKTDPYKAKEPVYETVINTDSVKAVIDAENVVNFYSGDTTKQVSGKDVEILNADTTLLKVSKSYFSTKEQTPRKDMVLILELDKYTLFNALIEDVQDNGTSYNLKVSRAPINKIFPELKVSVATDDAPIEMSRALGTSSVCHPFKVVEYNEDGTKEVYLATRATGSTEKTKHFDIGFDKDSLSFGDNFTFGLFRNNDVNDNAGLSLDINVGLYVDYTISDFKEARAWASINSMLRIPVFVKFKQDKEKRYTLFSKSLYSKRFDYWVMVGEVPVVFNFTPGVNVDIGATLKGDCMTNRTAFRFAYFPMANASISAQYKDGKWSCERNHEVRWDMDVPRMGPNAKIAIDAGIYPKIGFGVAYINFLEGKIGPALVVSATTGDKVHNTEYDNDQTTLDGRVSIDTRANIWAGAKICGFKVAGWNQWFTLSSTTIWENKFDVTLNNNNVKYVLK